MGTDEREKLEAEALVRLQGLSKEDLLKRAISYEVLKVEYRELSKECFENTERFKIVLDLSDIGGYADFEKAIKTALDYGLAYYIGEVGEVFCEVREWAEDCGFDTSKGFDLCGLVYQFLADKIVTNLQEAGIEIYEIPTFCKFLDSFFNIGDDFKESFRESFRMAVENNSLNLDELNKVSLEFIERDLNYSLDSLKELEVKIKSQEEKNE